MDKNLNFKNHYDLKYKISKSEIKIGHLSDTQLFIGKKQLKSIVKPSKEQLDQIEAMDYMIKQRSQMDQKQLFREFNNNPIIKAHKAKKLIIAKNTADLIETWLKKTTKLYKFNKNEKQNLQSHAVNKKFV